MDNQRETYFVLAAPSGAGKTTLVKALVERRNRNSAFRFPTRRGRSGSNEVDGVDYLFVEPGGCFAACRRRTTLTGTRAGLSTISTARAARAGRRAPGGRIVNVILEIDWQGARQVREAMPDCVTVFILPPSREPNWSAGCAAAGRTATRSSSRRLRDALSDMSHWNEFDHLHHQRRP